MDDFLRFIGGALLTVIIGFILVLMLIGSIDWLGKSSCQDKINNDKYKCISKWHVVKKDVK